MSCLAEDFLESGTLLFDRQAIPLDDAEWQQLDVLLNGLAYEHVVGGDAGEGHSVNVCRFYNDIDRPLPLHDRSEQIKAIVMSQKMRSFYAQFVGTDQLCLRRCQANLLGRGDYIGVHKDQDSNPDYYATVVFHFDSAYEGGAFITHDGVQGSREFRPGAHAVLVNNCSIPHEVASVEQGHRLTLACFLSKDFGDSGNPRHPFRVL